MWSAAEDEQELLAETVLSGQLRGEDDGARIIGNHLNAGSRAKISCYLEYAVGAERVRLYRRGTAGDRRDIDVVSTAPIDISPLPRHVAGTEVRARE